MITPIVLVVYIPKEVISTVFTVLIMIMMLMVEMLRSIY